MNSALGIVVLAYGQQSYPGVLQDLETEKVALEQVVLVQNPIAMNEPEFKVKSAVQLLRTERNGGYAYGMNAGMRVHLARNKDFVLLLTHDVRLRPGCLQDLLDSMSKVANYGALGPCLWDQRTGEPFSFGGLIGPGAQLRHSKFPPRELEDHEIYPADFLDGSVLLVNCRAFLEVGPFDERFFMYYEDTEWCLRLTNAGWKVGVVAKANAEQAPGGPKRPGAFSFLFMRNGMELSRRVLGTKGLKAELRRQITHARMACRSLLRWRNAEARRYGLAQLVGITVGFAAFIFRWWGPPPSWLPGMGDIGRSADAAQDGETIDNSLSA